MDLFEHSLLVVMIILNGDKVIQMPTWQCDRICGPSVMARVWHLILLQAFLRDARALLVEPGQVWD